MSKIEIEADVPDGWVAVAYRAPLDGEWYLGKHGPAQAKCDGLCPWLILRRVEPKKESGWQPVSLLGGTYSTLLGAQVAHPNSRIQRIDYENGHPVSVALESVEGKG